MEKRIIYRTEVTVSNMMLEAEREIRICGEEVKMVYLTGCILRSSQRKLLGIIPLPDKYTYKVCPHIYVRNKYTDKVSKAKCIELRKQEATHGGETELRVMAAQQVQAVQAKQAGGVTKSGWRGKQNPYSIRFFVYHHQELMYHQILSDGWSLSSSSRKLRASSHDFCNSRVRSRNHERSVSIWFEYMRLTVTQKSQKL